MVTYFYILLLAILAKRHLLDSSDFCYDIRAMINTPRPSLCNQILRFSDIAWNFYASFNDSSVKFHKASSNTRTEDM